MSYGTIFIDLSGRVSKNIIGFRYLTCSAVFVPRASLSSMEERLGAGTPKWRDATDSSLDLALELLSSPGVHSLSAVFDRDTPAWAACWTDLEAFDKAAERLYGTDSSFLNPAVLARCFCFGEVEARLAGEVLRRDGPPPILDPAGRNSLLLRVVCDAEIQGVEALDFFQRLWERFDDSGQPLLSQHGLRIIHSEVVMKTEQDEPMLLLADYLAGLTQTVSGSPAVPIPRGLSLSVPDVEQRLNSIPSHALVPMAFGLDAKAMLDPKFQAHLLGSPEPSNRERARRAAEPRLD